MPNGPRCLLPPSAHLPSDASSATAVSVANSTTAAHIQNATASAVAVAIASACGGADVSAVARAAAEAVATATAEAFASATTSVQVNGEQNSGAAAVGLQGGDVVLLHSLGVLSSYVGRNGWDYACV